MILKRMLILLLTLMLLPLAEGEETPAPETVAPILVDRINSPESNADFSFAEDAQLFEVFCPQILDCDAFLLRCGGETLLVDCATQGQAARIIDMCRQLGVTRIDRVINTHPHADHIGGFRDLIKSVEVGEMWICFPQDYNDHMIKAMGHAERAGIPVKTYADGDTLTLGGATIDVWKLEGGIAKMNDCSAQFFITYGERTMLMAADLEGEGQTNYVNLKGEALRADILKYPHHGLEKLRNAYMEAVSPRFMFVTNNLKENEGRQYIRTCGVPSGYTVPGILYLATDGHTWVADRIPSEIKY